MDLTSLTDDEFNQYELEVRIDRERRDNLERIPNDISTMAAKYRELGGDESVIADAVADPNQQSDDSHELRVTYGVNTQE